MRTMLAAGACALALSTAHADFVRPGGTWEAPSCRHVAGAPLVAITSDEGATLATSPRPVRGTDYAFGLAILKDVPNTMLLAHNRTLQRSTTAGCRWMTIGEIPTTSDGFPASLAAARGDRAYAWSDNRNDLVRIDGKVMTALRSPVESIVGIATDPLDTNGVRLAGGDGSLWISRDGGDRFEQQSSPARGLLFYRAGFDPSNLDHVVFGVASVGAYVTFDGGQTWTRSTGLSSTGTGPVNVFNVVVSPADPQRVFVMGLDIAEADSGAPSQGRHIYLSRDGGLTFEPVVDASADVTIPNQSPMAAHPTNHDVVYFTFGTSFFGYGADLYKYDDTTGQVTKTHNDYHRIPVVDFNPVDPNVMYLGLGLEQVN
ncbi:MAG TPA: hypothetical protein VJ826_01405 [Candidatus Polarisedimenticolaceae bacterium]|nr:hypothetical protein [Candidatus Polarisedimenticolaceae bacterium]